MSDDITLRRATQSDEKILFDWRNDEETRRQSLTTTSVEWEGHVAWLEKSLQNPDRILVIAEITGEPIGTCRADLRDDGFTEISYTIAPSSRGKGLSKPMVMQFVQEFLEGKQLVATVKGDNKSSESVVRALGMKRFSEKHSEDPTDPRPLFEWR